LKPKNTKTPKVGEKITKAELLVYQVWDVHTSMKLGASWTKSRLEK